MLRVLLVTSDRDQCGVREYGRFLKGAVEKADEGIEIDEFPDTGPGEVGRAEGYDVLHLNHHAALHSRWKREIIERLQGQDCPVVVTQHDTFETAEIMRERNFEDFRGANLLVVHEPVEGLQTQGLMRGHMKEVGAFRAGAHLGVKYLRQPVPAHLWTFRRPRTHPKWRGVLGLCGFDFPWKGFEPAIRGTREADWGCLLFSPNITIDRAEELQQMHPTGLQIIPGWSSAGDIVKSLSACDATAFLYSTGNSGTSGAIRLGLAARRPLLATPGCRQHRDLAQSVAGSRAITWIQPRVKDVADELGLLEAKPYWETRQRRIEELAEGDSWAQAGEVYAQAYRALGARGDGTYVGD
jgi:hypothetical protein